MQVGRKDIQASRNHLRTKSKFETNILLLLYWKIKTLLKNLVFLGSIALNEFLLQQRYTTQDNMGYFLGQCLWVYLIVGLPTVP